MADPRHGTAPIVIEETPGKRAYCQCGLSEKLPYCDGAHNRHNTGLAPERQQTVVRRHAQEPELSGVGGAGGGAPPGGPPDDRPGARAAIAAADRWGRLPARACAGFGVGASNPL